MPVNVNSLRARLLNISREKKVDFQLLLNRLGAEQFLYRLSRSPYAQKFIFKGGALLTYLMETERKTKDLDFSIKQFTNRVDEIVKVIRSVLDIPVDDGFEWRDVEGEPLVHPDRDTPGTRIICRFLFGTAKGVVRTDMATGDTVDAVIMSLQRMKYKGQPFFAEPISLLVYPPEATFSEKLSIVLKKGGQNTRMKDYYDLMKLTTQTLDIKKLEGCIRATFDNRAISPSRQIHFKEGDLDRLQLYWEHFLKRDKLENLPPKISEVIRTINIFLKKLYDEQT